MKYRKMRDVADLLLRMRKAGRSEISCVVACVAALEDLAARSQSDAIAWDAEAARRLLDDIRRIWFHWSSRTSPRLNEPQDETSGELAIHFRKTAAEACGDFLDGKLSGYLECERYWLSRHWRNGVC